MQHDDRYARVVKRSAGRVLSLTHCAFNKISDSNFFTQALEISIMPAKSRRIRFTREQWLHYLLKTAEERICASCWAGQLEEYLDELLGADLVIFSDFIFVPQCSTDVILNNSKNDCGEVILHSPFAHKQRLQMWRWRPSCCWERLCMWGG